jgi:hypothetical protein
MEESWRQPDAATINRDGGHAQMNGLDRRIASGTDLTFGALLMAA